MRMRGVVCGCGAVRADPAFGNKSRWHATREPSPLRGDGPVCCLGRIRRGCACSVCVQCVCVCVASVGPCVASVGPWRCGARLGARRAVDAYFTHGRSQRVHVTRDQLP